VGNVVVGTEDGEVEGRIVGVIVVHLVVGDRVD